MYKNAGIVQARSLTFLLNGFVKFGGELRRLSFSSATYPTQYRGVLRRIRGDDEPAQRLRNEEPESGGNQGVPHDIA